MGGLGGEYYRPCDADHDLALAATSLNLVLGYGGMISFGHAAFFGAGAYTVAILAKEGLVAGLAAWPLAAVSALCALIVGAISLRTRGLYFIMITLAFAQMLYYFFLSLRAYGGEDGIDSPGARCFRVSTSRTAPISISSCWCCSPAATTCCGAWRRPFGAVMRGIRENETRMTALGYATTAIDWCSPIAGGVAGLAR